MCEDWITEKYIDDVRNAAKNNYAAIKIYCDKRAFIYHPSKNGLIGQRWT